MSYDYNTLSGAALLRADPYSQRIMIKNGEIEKPLVSDKAFWGEKPSSSLYYSFRAPENKDGYAVACEGWNDYSEKTTDQMNPEQTQEWVQDNLYNTNNQNLCVIQGYAGCGKTTFVQSLLYDLKAFDSCFEYHNFYIGYIENAIENTFIPSSIRTKLEEKIINTLKNDRGLDIYNCFINIIKSDLEELSPDLHSTFAPVFYADDEGSLYKYAIQLYENRNTENLEECIKNFRVQFNQSLNSKAGIYRLSSSNKNTTPYNELLGVLLFVDLLWCCALYISGEVSSNVNQFIIYDNLDIIENHYIVSDFIDILRSVHSNYNKFKRQSKQSLPCFKVVLTVRKITYAGISKFIEVGGDEENQITTDVDFIDISNLYVSSNVLKHKASTLLDSLDDYVPANAPCRAKITNYLMEIKDSSNKVFRDIEFSRFLNHNLRACANMMEQVIFSNSYQKNISSKEQRSISLPNKCKSAIWIHSICKVLNKNHVWENLGYNRSDSDKLLYPSTISRMILTYLRNCRLGYTQDKEGFLSSDVSFKDIVNVFEKIPFAKYPKNQSWDSIKDDLNNTYNSKDVQTIIVNSIAKMLQRNALFERTELWRRPLYYTYNAFPLNNYDEITKRLSHQIEDEFGKQKSIITSFCITDEGDTFVKQVATHFEFYSVRYNNNDSEEPICCIYDEKKLNKLISRVYQQVEYCVEKQTWLMDYYINNYHLNKNDYLSELFHPRTSDFIPQLHIVRTIYSHIDYLNVCRNYFYKLFRNDSRFDRLNECLLSWIGKYLKLYRNSFYDRLKDTLGEYNNKIWIDLRYLYWLITLDNRKIGNVEIGTKIIRYITLNRFSHIQKARDKNRIINSKYKISNDELLKNNYYIEFDI